jgi:hypothetical protein
MILKRESVFLRSVSNLFRIAVISLLLNIPSKPGVYGQDPVINEFMSRNDTTMQDQDGDYPDWIELYNPGEQAVGLLNYSLSDNLTEARKWIFPEVSIGPKGYLVLFASGKDRSDAGELHTSFKISSEGEPLILTNHGGAVIDLVDSVGLADDQVLARFPDGGSQWLTSTLPTPGGPNEVNNQLLFSHKQGFYEVPFHLEVSSLNGDTVRYTLDGSVPTEGSDAISGSLYLDYKSAEPNLFSEIPTTPLQNKIDYKAWESPRIKIDKAWVIRSASFRDGVQISPVHTRTYFIDSHISDKYTMPVISLVTDSLNLFSADSGIYLPGKSFDSEEPQWSGNYFQRGRSWERPVHLEYFTPEGEVGLSQDAGLRIHGGKSRQAAQKTLRIYARDVYGLDRFHFNLLPQKEVDEYKQFLLRTSMGSWNGQAVITDVLAHEIVRDLDIEMIDYQPVVVYLNGEYWGIHTLRDRPNERYIEYTTGVDKDSIDLINGNISLVDAGSNEHYLKLAEFIVSNDLSVPGNYEHVATQIEISSFVDYIIAEMFFSNDDWPGNNQLLWRPQTPEGKWRWIFFDLDAAYRNAEANIFERAMLKEGEVEWESEPVSSFLLRNLLKNSRFKSYFLGRFAEILKEEFNENNIFYKLSAIEDLYKPEMERHIQRWHYPSSLKSWESDVESYLLNFLIGRPCEVAHQLIDYFNLEEFGFHCLGQDEFDKNFVLAPNPTDGIFFLRNRSFKSVIGHIVITDVSGRVIHFENGVFLDHLQEKYFDLTGLTGGIYYMKFFNSNLSVVKPLVIY